MTKEELYRELCVEAGTLIAPELSPEDWYNECSHNIHPGLDGDLQLAAAGDANALADCRTVCGLPLFA